MSDVEALRREQIAGLKGKELIFHSGEEIGKGTIRRFAATMGDHNPLYWDDEFAEKSPYGGVVAPPTMLFELTYDLKTVFSEDGLHEGFKALFGTGANIQRAGNEYEMVRPVSPEDIISQRHRIIDVTEKKGRTGRFALVTNEITYRNQKEEILGINKEILVIPIAEDEGSQEGDGHGI